MIRKKSILGVLCASALAICAVGAFAASSASAAEYTLHECKTFVSGTETATRYTSNTCETVSTSGGFQTVPFAVNTPVAVTATATSNFTLAATVAGIPFEIQCTGIESPNQKATNEVVEGKMVVHGTGGKTKFTGCHVTKPAGRNCHVPETLETETLTSITDSTGGTTFKPASGETFITIPVTECTSEALNGNKAVKGTARSARVTAATQQFSSTSGSSLTFGGQPATFEGSYHLKGPGGNILGLETP